MGHSVSALSCDFTSGPYFPTQHLLELISQAKQPQKLDIAHSRLQMTVEGCQCGVGDVVVTGNATQICHLEVARSPVIPA